MVEMVIDASQGSLSLAIIKNNNLIYDKTIRCKNNLSEILLKEIDNTLQINKLELSDLEKLVVSKGPGSYTGLRVVLSVVKSLAYVLNIELKLISSLKLQAAPYLSNNILVVPIIDGRRGNIFTAVYNNAVELLKDGYYSFEEVIKILKDYEEKVIFVGTDAKNFDYTNFNKDYEIIEENINAKNIIRIRNFEELTNAYDAKPSYLRITEAERNLKDDKNK